MNPNNESYNWVEITKDFFEATPELKLGELLNEETFGLYEAMSAIEMMDPKMDAGMMCNRGNKKVMNFEQALKCGKLKIQDLTVEEHIGIIDATLACLVTWLEGHSLAQTVFTNLYLHKPLQIEDRVIKAFSICVLKIIEVIREFVNKASVFEEEDCQPVMYGYSLADNVTDVRAAGMMREVEEELQRKVKTTRSKPGEEQDLNMQLMHESTVAVYSRIKFCRLLYQAFLLLSKKKRSGIQEAETHLRHCLELIPIIQRTIELGVQPNNSMETTNRADYPTIMGFEPLVNQRLLPPTFPRYTKIKSRKESTEYLEALVHRLCHVGNISECGAFHSALDFFTEFSKSSPCVLSRSVLQLLYQSQTPKMVDVLWEAIKIFIKPPALMSKSPLMNNPQAKEYVGAFLCHCVRPYSDLLQIYGHNRARQRDKLAHLLEDLVILQDEADKVDAFLHNLSQKSENPLPHLACFGTWILYHTLKVMIQYVLSGFELELYSIHEYSYIFWYLYEFLYGWLVSALSRAENFLIEQEVRSEQQQVKTRNTKKNKKKKKGRPHAKELLLNQALQNLCGGYYKAVAGFNLEGKIKHPYVEFENEQVRYKHRFAPFNSVITPPPVQYSQYREMTDFGRYVPKPSSEDLFSAACKCFQYAKMFLESISEPNEEVVTIMKVAKTNFVVMKLLLSGHKKQATDYPEFDFSVHKNFPLIKI